MFPLYSKTFACTVPGCYKEAVSEAALYTHKRRYHPELRQKRTIAEEEKLFECKTCHLKLATINGLRKHCRGKSHVACTVIPKVAKAQCQCPDCPLIFPSHKKWLQHGKEDHAWEINIENGTFNSKDEFDKWLSDIRRDNSIDFVATTGKTLIRKTGALMQYLRCSQSGAAKNHVSSGKRKSRVSVKSGSICSAFLRVIENPDRTVEAEYCVDHMGHEANLKKIRLSHEEKNVIREVLNETKDISMAMNKLSTLYASNSGERLSHTTRKEVQNVKAGMKLELQPPSKEEKLRQNLLRMVSDLKGNYLKEAHKSVKEICRRCLKNESVEEEQKNCRNSSKTRQRHSTEEP